MFIPHVLLMNFQFLHGEILWTVGWHDTLAGHASHGPSFKVSAVPAQKHGRQLQEASLKLRNPLWYPKFDHHFHNFCLGGYTSYTLHCLFNFSHTRIPSDYLWQFAMNWFGKSDANVRFPITINYQRVRRNIDHWHKLPILLVGWWK